MKYWKISIEEALSHMMTIQNSALEIKESLFTLKNITSIHLLDNLAAIN